MFLVLPQSTAFETWQTAVLLDYASDRKTRKIIGRGKPRELQPTEGMRATARITDIDAG